MLRRAPFILATLFLITQSLFSQQKKTNYDVRWKLVDSLIDKKGLPKSALAEINTIYSIAKKEKQEAQVLKALFYKIGLEEKTAENAPVSNIALLETELKTSNGAAQYILLSMLAETYRTYYLAHRYQLYSRTQTEGFKKEDVATWGIADFHKKITALFLASIGNETLLQQTKLEPYDAIIIKGNVRYLRPTLYDLLVFRALDYFESDERDITKPAYAFEIRDAAAFEPAADFIHHKFTTKDSSSLQHKALLLYQQLLAFHLNDKKPDALIDADIHRIEFVHRKAVMEEKEPWYKMSLEHVAHQYESYPAAAQAWYLLAQQYASTAAAYNAATDTSHRFDYLSAKNICEKILQQKEESEGKANCYNLLLSIQHKELNLLTEKVNVPAQPFRTLVSYRNFTQLHFRIIPLTEALEKQMGNDRYSDKYWEQLVKFSFTKNWSQQLPDTKDYQLHSAEIKIEALPVGQYLLLASVKEDFNTSENPLAVQTFYVSGISYVNNATEYFVLNRETGKPLVNATMQQWWNEYDYNTRTFKKTKGQTLQTNANGYAKFASYTKPRNGNPQIEVTYEKDRLLLESYNNIFYRNSNTDDSYEKTDAADYERDKATVFFFTDRSIYRPGQTIYFKGIVVTKDFITRKSKILTNASSYVVLFNANRQKVDSIKVTTNEYGSYSGTFKLPQAGLLSGQFYLDDASFNGNAYFSVEEYKRPKFYVEYEKQKGSYKVNDSITVHGSAKAYAGNNIDGAKVTYRVQRVARFLYPWLYWKWGYPRSSNLEITNGAVTTAADGSFTITFKAIPDASVKKELEPVFDYRVTADITDNNGETRSGETIIPVSYKALQLNISVPQGETIPADSLKQLYVRTQNIAGSFEPALVKVIITKLQSPDRLMRKRYWQQPDQFTMTKEEFIKNFPYDEYQGESDYRNWPKGAVVVEKTDSSKENSQFLIPKSQITEGWHIIEATTKDKYGLEVKNVAYVLLYNEQSGKTPFSTYLFSTQKNGVVEPGQASTISIGSAADDVFVVQQVQKQVQSTKYEVAGQQSAVNGQQPAGKNDGSLYNFITLNNEKKDFSFNTTEADRGGYGVFHVFVKHNRVYTTSNTVSVPWTNKELTISYATFRDKTLPGSKEKWQLKIAGYKNEKVAAEMVAGMYDASLDQFKPHSWNTPNVWDTYYSMSNWDGAICFSQVQSQEKYLTSVGKTFNKYYDELLHRPNEPLWWINPAEYGYIFPGNRAQASIKNVNIMQHDMNADIREFSVGAVQRKTALPYEPLRESSAAGMLAAVPSVNVADDEKKPDDVPVQIRKNFNETAFFFPNLKTDSTGNIVFEFTIPEALTQWKFQALAHTKDLAFGFSKNTTVTQKPLMVQPNAPRFLREGDKIELSAKVVNLTDKEITGTVQLELFNTATNEPADGWFRNMYPVQYFTAPANQSTAVKFIIDVPYQYNSAMTYRFVAKDSTNSDGEEASIPVLTNSMLVTESMPLPIRGNAAKNFRFEKLLQSGNSETLQHHALTVEFTTNPAWYAVQALPYLMDYPYECAEQTFNRYYANALATKIANASPKLKAVFEQWKTTDTSALLSNLQKNEELKSILLEETPWVMDAKNEAQQKKNIALLFDMVKMSASLSSSYQKLKELQSSNGGFVWFKGGPDDRYMTQYIITGLGHLKKLGALNDAQQKAWGKVIPNAIKYLDARIKEDYDNLIKYKSDLKKNQLSYIQVQYLYMRSFFNDIDIPGASFTAVNFYRKQSQQFWLSQNRYMQGMVALSLFRTGDIKTANDILKSLQQNAIVSEEMGMYWKDNTAGYFWHQAPVETQSLLLEAFSEIKKDNKTTDDLKTWLLKQKQVQNWRTTKATADACYALLLQGSDWLNNTPTVEIKLGDKTISSPTGGGREGAEAEAGTGYFKKSIAGPFVKPAMGEISVKVASGANNSASSWGAVYWQYFEHLDKITSAATPLKLVKKLFVETNTAKGPVLTPVNENDYLHVGDKIKVRIELRVDRDMEYIHMKDMRASCMEPVNVLSGYKWQGGLGYYETTKDASTNLFFGWLPKGTYVFEYPLFVTHTGNFSNGVTSIQSMYAPEFGAHSEGVRVNVEEKK